MVVQETGSSALPVLSRQETGTNILDAAYDTLIKVEDALDSLGMKLEQPSRIPTPLTKLSWLY